MHNNVVTLNADVIERARHALLPLCVDQLRLSFGSKPVLRGLSFQLADAGITAIMGPNGAGKSLALRVIAGLIQQDSGEVSFAGTVSPKARLGVGFVFQRPVLLRRSVEDNLRHALKLAGLVGRAGQLKLAELLALGGLEALAKSPARRLSGGEQQRLALVRALAAGPQVLLLDEPSASLDPRATFLIEKIIRDISAVGVKVIVVTHDQAQAQRLAHDVLFIHEGLCTEHTRADAFFKKPSSKQATAYLAGQLLFDQ